MAIDHGGIVQFKVRQVEPLTTRLHGLIRDYPKGVGIAKEFIQNADDAGASRIDFVLDWRTHESERLPATTMAKLAGPALLILNDRAFTDRDFESILRIGDSAKTQDLVKTGRFGLGFNASYNITDYPSFLSRNRLYFFDPHENAVPEEFGGGWELSPALWETYPDLLVPFTAAGLAENETNFEGTIFRLPLRSEILAQQSKITTDPFSENDFHQIVDQLSKLGDDLLIFLKHVLSMTVQEIPMSGIEDRRILLAITTENSEEVSKHRRALVDAIPDGNDALLRLLRDEATNLPTQVYRHSILVQGEAGERRTTWQVASGLYGGSGGELAHAAEQMMAHEEKAVPWAGVAAKLTTTTEGQLSFEPISGHVYVFLPMELETHLPVHLNGFFDLDSSRHGLTAGQLLGKDQIRVHWNKMLAEHGVAIAYAQLLNALTEVIDVPSVDAFYKLWPDSSASFPEAIAGLPAAVYSHLSELSVIHAAGSEWQPVAELWIPPKESGVLQDALVNIGLPVPDPPLPDHVQAGLTQVYAQVDLLTPEVVRRNLRRADDINLPVQGIANPGLRRREWLVALLKFCLKDASGTDLVGLPLALLADGKVHTFGKNVGGTIYIANSQERSIFEMCPHWFIDETFAEECGLRAFPDAKLVEMTPALLVNNLSTVLKESKTGTTTPWNPDEETPPNAVWLGKVYQYLADAGPSSRGWIGQAFVRLPIVPDQYKQLHVVNTDTTPLFMSTEVGTGAPLRKVLEAFRIPIVSGPPELLDAIDEFRRSFPGRFIWSVTGPDLVDTLHAVAMNGTLWPEYNAKLHGRLLDFLAESRWTEEFHSDGGQRLEKLAELPIFPTTDETLTSINDAVYIFDGLRPPRVAGEIQLLNAGPGNRWYSLLSAVGAKALDHRTLIENVLLPNYRDMDAEAQRQVIEWIRLHREETETKTTKSESDVRTFRSNIALAPLVRCTDGELHPIASTYDPTAEIVPPVLGKHAWIPDMTFYEHDQGQWLEFFKLLGMSDTPRPTDLLRYIDDLIETSENEGTSRVRESLLVVFKHIVEHWEILANEEISTGDRNSKSFVQELQARTWLPAIVDHRRLRYYPGFVVPEDRLYRSSDLELPDNGALISSQRPIASIPTRLEVRIRHALGFALSPSPKNVAAHFDHLLDLWEEGSIEDDRIADFEASLVQIYRFFGNPRIGKGVGDDADEDIVFWLHDHFADRRCLWDRASKRFWLPRHVFSQPVKFFGERRTTIQIQRISEDQINLDRGLETLGRRDEPTAVDFIDYLDELGESYGASPLPAEELDNALQVLHRLGRSLLAEGAVVSEFLVPTRAGCLISSSQVILDDAPWYEEALRDAPIHLLHSKVDESIVELTKMDRLSQCVEERLAGELVGDDDERTTMWCNKWQATLRSMEFKHGLFRLVKQQRELDIADRLEWLGSSSVTPVQSIEVDLFISRNGFEEQVGSSEADYYHSASNSDFFLKAQQYGLMVNFLADAINKRLGTANLHDRSKLIAILDTNPGRIHELLNKLRVPSYSLPSTEQPDDLDEEDERANSEFYQGVWVTPDAEDFEVSSISDDDLASYESRPEIVEEEVGAGSAPLPQNRKVSSNGGRTGEVESVGDLKPSSSSEREPRPSGGPYIASFANGGSLSEHSATSSPTLSDRAPTTPGHGRSSKAHSTNSESKRQDRVVTYVGPMGQDTQEDDPSNDELPANEAMRIGEAAVEHVLAFEAKAGRNAQPMPHNNHGYDVKSEEVNTELSRYIEVKGINGPWADRGVPLSAKQFEYAQRHGEQFWLYVVEYAREAERAKVYPIRNPASLINQFRFDSGWRQLAEVDENALSSIEPREGLHIRIRGQEGVIGRVVKGGALCRIDVRFEDGSQTTQIFDPSKMILLPPDGD